MPKIWFNPKDDESQDFIRCLLTPLPLELYEHPAYRISIKPGLFVDIVQSGDGITGIPYLNGIAGLNPHRKEKAPGDNTAGAK